MQKKQKGQSIVEFALVLPLFLCIGMILADDIGRLSRMRCLRPGIFDGLPVKSSTSAL